MSLYDCRKCGRINVPFDHNCEPRHAAKLHGPSKLMLKDRLEKQAKERAAKEPK